MVSEFDIPELEYFNQASSLKIELNTWIDGYVDGPHGKIPRLKTSLNNKDRIGAAKVRLGIGRDGYAVFPGLYAIGSPDKTCPVLITANYKLTLDMLRKELSGMNAWIVVVDTKGVNVWCAAGKGTFGTYEVIKKLKELKLKDLVNHRNVILPQLCASGVAAYQIIRHTGFKAIFGPVQAKDIKEFIQNGMKATEKMRTIDFPVSSRLILTPVEVVHSLKLLLIMLICVLIYNIAYYSAMNFATIISASLAAFVPLLAAVISGCVLVPALLPYIPFRALAAKGLVIGLVLDMALLLFMDSITILKGNNLLLAAYCILIPAVTAMLSLNFTGSTTYTSFSGVKKETELTLPFVKVSIAISIILALISVMAILYRRLL